jgi:hypothetical protein
MPSEGDYFPLTVIQILNDINLAINDLNIHGNVSKWSSLVSKVGLVTKTDTPAPRADSYLRFLSDMKRRFADSVNSVLKSLTYNVQQVAAANSLLEEIDLGTFANMGTAANRSAIVSSLTTIKEYFPYISNIEYVASDYSDRITRDMTRSLEELDDINPYNSMRWRRKYPDLIAHPCQGVVEGAVNSGTVMGKTEHIGNALLISYYLRRDGTGAVQLANDGVVVATRLSSGVYTVKFAPGKDHHILIPDAAGDVVLSEAKAALATAIMPSLAVYTDNDTLVERVALSIDVPTRLSVAYDNCYMKIEWTAAITPANFAATAGDSSYLKWEMLPTLDTLVVATVSDAIVSSTEFTDTTRGDALRHLAIVDKYLSSIGVQTIASLIKTKYNSLTGAALNVPDAALYDFNWWLGSDIAVGDRPALATTYRGLHAYLSSFLPYVFASTSYHNFVIRGF